MEKGHIDHEQDVQQDRASATNPWGTGRRLHLGHSSHDKSSNRQFAVAEQEQRLEWRQLRSEPVKGATRPGLVGAHHLVEHAERRQAEREEQDVPVVMIRVLVLPLDARLLYY